MNYEILKNTLNTERACREYLASIRWKNGFCCPKCKENEAWVTNETRYKCKRCGHKMSVTSGTVFQDSHIPLTKWFSAISLLLKNKDITVDEFQNELDIGSNRTAIRIKNLIIKNIVLVHLPENPRLLNGNIELTRRQFRYKNNRVFAYMAVETENEKNRHIAIQEEINDKSLAEFLKTNIQPKSNKQTIISSPIYSVSDYSDIYNIAKADARKHFSLSKKHETAMNQYLRKFEYRMSFNEICDFYVSRHNINSAPIDYSASYIKTLEKMLKTKNATP